MDANYLEQLIAEWDEYPGYFVRCPVLVGKRPPGGHEGEPDVVAFHPQKKHPVHLESSMDVDSRAERQTRYEKKFKVGRRYIPMLFEGPGELPDGIEQMAVLGFAGKTHHEKLGGGHLFLIRELLEGIFRDLKD